VTAVANQQVGAFAQSRRQVKSGDAASGPAPLSAIASDDNRGAIELLKDARGDDAHNADVPKGLAFDDDEVIFGFELGADGRNGFFRYAAFDFLALTVFSIQLLGERHRGAHVARHQEVQGRLSRLKPASGIETRSKLETDLMSANADRRLSDALERGKTGPTRGVQPFQSCRYQNAIFAGERNDVRDSAESDEIEQWPEVVISSARKIRFAAALYDGVSEFEGEAN
jgi:hypothetical protein